MKINSVTLQSLAVRESQYPGENLPEFLLVGLQKFHADEFGFDFDDKEAKEKQLVKMYDLLDDYLDPENEEGKDIMSLYDDLTAELEKNSFLSKLLAKEEQAAKKKPTKK